MPPSTFRCYLVTKDEAGKAHGEITEKRIEELPEGDVLIRVAYSSLNFKDAISASGAPGVTRKYPHIPGIDAAGAVVKSNSPEFSTGDPVLVTGYDLGQNTWGGYSQFIRVPAKWVVPIPTGLTEREAMIYGTAGFTAAQCVDALERHGVTPASGDVVVTGASGGVGSVAVAILAKLGYKVVAVSGKPAAHDLLKRAGAAEIISREEVNDTSDKPLLPARWKGAVDTVGGNTLATILRSLSHRGCAAACGLVGGAGLKMTVMPFLLRGVTLAGIDSAECPMEPRKELWRRLATIWKPDCLNELASETDFAGLGAHVQQILAGQIIGRALVVPPADC